MPITLISYIGGKNHALVPHFLKHYRSLGITDFYIIAANEPDTLAALQAAGITPAIIDPEEFHMARKQKFIDERTMAAPVSEWFVLADLDEFHVFDRPLPDMISYCLEHKYHAARGYFIDRHAEDGKLIDLAGVTDVWSAFPYTSQFTRLVFSRRNDKVVLLQGGFRTNMGHHQPADGATQWLSSIEVHHFKWDSTAIERMLKRCYTNMLVEQQWRSATNALRLLQVIAYNNGSIPLALARAKRGGGFYDGTWTPQLQDGFLWHVIRKLERSSMRCHMFFGDVLHDLRRLMKKSAGRIPFLKHS